MILFVLPFLFGTVLIVLSEWQQAAHWIEEGAATGSTISAADRRNTLNHAGAVIWYTEENVFVDTSKIELAGPLRIDDRRHHVSEVPGEQVLQQDEQVTDLVLVNGDNKHTVGLRSRFASSRRRFIIDNHLLWRY